ncbi:MAG: DUF2807 domain-containing protein, partial [Devosia sp.]
MNKLSIAASAALLLLSSTAVFAETRTLDVGSFKGVEIASGIKADISVGGAQSVVAEGLNAGDFDSFRYEVRGEVLYVWYDWNIFQIFDFSAHRMSLTISVPGINSATITSGSNAEIRGVTGDHLKAEVTSGASARIYDAAASSYSLSATSGANLTIDGTCVSATAEATTGASVSAKDLLCADVKAEATTGASVKIAASATFEGESTTGAGIT